ncbi:MAG: MBL fold metallo-hydrolase, partial [Candidatus Acidiferrales bacterium]
MLDQIFSGSLSAALPGTASVAGARGDAGVDAARAKFGKIPIATTTLADNLTLLSGPGGNVVVLNGGDGKLLVDTFVSSAWDGLQKALDNLGDAPLKFAIDTHWHWDHTDNNANVRGAGAELIAHVNTRKRMSEPHVLEILNYHFDPFIPAAIPQHTFKESYEMDFNGEHLTLGHMAPAHTDTDIFVHFQKANVLHMGDVFFNGIYCYIDRGTGGKIAGVIAGSDKMLAMVDNDTKVVPGHGPLGNKADLKKYRD